MNNTVSNLGFLVGFPRSGTTMLASKLGEFSRISSPPETLYLQDMVGVRFASGRPVPRQDFLRELASRYRIADLDLDYGEVFPAERFAQVDRYEALAELLHAYRLRDGADFVVEKSPVHTYYLAEILQHYPQSRVVALVRDGRDALLSLHRTPWSAWSDERWAADWVYRNSIILDCAKRFPDRVQVVRFEDVVAEADTLVPSLAAWLFGTDTLGSHNGENVSAIPDWERAWKTKAGGSVDASRAFAWKQDASNPAVKTFENIAGDMLRKLGYESSASTVAGRTRAKLFAALFPALGFWRKIRSAVAKGYTLKSDENAKKLADGS